MYFDRLSRGICAAVLAAPLAFATPSWAETVLRVIPHADLKNLDPIWTTAYISRNHGYMIYDTLFAMDEDFKPQPQMVDTWTTSEDGMVWTFVLRDGLMFHDGTPVTGEDVVASLNRWGQRDGMGQQLYKNMESLVATDEKTDPFEQITDYTGSGPFKFEEEEWVPGNTIVYTKFDDYVPREEPSSAASGGKIAKVDKVIWQYFPDNTTAMNALMAGEVAFFAQPAPELATFLNTYPDVTGEVNDPLGNIGFARFNHLLPPFDNADVRRAAINAMKQEDYLAAAIGDPEFWKTCYSVFPCGTPLANDAGSEVIETADIDAAKAKLAETGYDGTEVVIMQPTDIPVLSAFSLVSAEKLRNAGFNVNLEAMDWATLTSRRALRDPVGEGGWNIFHTWWIGADVIDPMAIAFSGDPDAGWFGWAEDAELEKARSAFAVASTPEEKAEHATKVQERLWAIGASGQLGQFFVPVAYRNNVKGLIKSPVQFFWNMSVE